MAIESHDRAPLIRRRTSRRALLGVTAVGAGSLALAYGAWRDPLGLFDDASSADAVRADTDAITQESVRVSHLLRRAGFGATAEEHEHYQSLGLQGSIDELVNYTRVDDSAAEALASQVTLDANNRAAPVVWWLTRMANTKRPLQEKMTLFWHGLLTSQISVVRDATAMVAQNELFRAHAFDTFPAILRAVSQDPAMMEYLNVTGSVKGAPNENYARELMELFSLGIGSYTEQDVREAARAFTGWNVPRTRLDNGYTLNAPVFRPNQFDNGSKTFLGRTGNLRPDDIVDTIVAQPASAAYITRRLFSFFVYPDPSDDDLKPFIDVYNHNDRSIGAVVEALLRSDVFVSPKAYRAVVKSPTEYFVGAIKAIGAQAVVPALTSMNRAGAARDGGVLGDMGQMLFEPPNVAGWPGGANWLNSATVFGRLNFLNQLTGGVAPLRPRQAPVLPDLAAGTTTVSQALARYLPLALDDNLPDDAHQVFADYAGMPDATLTPEQQRGLVYLVLGAPQFHLA